MQFEYQAQSGYPKKAANQPAASGP